MVRFTYMPLNTFRLRPPNGKTVNNIIIYHNVLRTRRFLLNDTSIQYIQDDLLKTFARLIFFFSVEFRVRSNFRFSEFSSVFQSLKTRILRFLTALEEFGVLHAVIPTLVLSSNENLHYTQLCLKFHKRTKLQTETDKFEYISSEF